MIDFHVHLGRLFQRFPPLQPTTLLRRMDRLGIEMAVVLAVENPEETDFYIQSDQVLKMCKRHPDRLIPFCCVDPRHGVRGEFDPLPILTEFLDRGAKGYGENLCGLEIDDLRILKTYEACEKLSLPVVLHMDSYINVDKPGLVGLEKILKLFPQVNFVAHAMCFWGEISQRVDYSILYPEMGPAGYPTGPVVPGGRVEQLLSQYPNLYADLSAFSAYNALSRDEEFGHRFLEKFCYKLLFATDYLRPRQPLPIVKFIKQAPISTQAFKQITHLNAAKLLRLN